MTSYETTFNPNSGLQVGHNSGNIYYASSAPGREVDTAFDVPDLLSPFFTGRKDEIARLKEIYQASRTSGPARCIVYGMPGLGKTQLALRFAHSSKEDYLFIFWISGASIEKFNSGFLGIFDHFGGEARDESARNRAVKKWLENQEKRWLLIIDNVNEQTAPHLRDMLPVKNAKGNVLITTRYQSIAESLEFAHGEKHSAMELPNLEEGDAVDLFFAIRHKHRQDTDSSEYEDAKIIAKKVGCLPLAIDQAASLSNTPGQTVRKVMEIYHSPESNEALEWDSETTKHESMSVMACFGPVLDQLDRSSPEASILLRIFAFLDPESIPIELLKNGIIDFEPRKHDTSSPQPSGKRRIEEHLQKKNTKVNSQAISYNINDKDLEDETDMQRLRAVFGSPVKLQKLIQALRRLSIVKVKDHENFWIHDLVHQLIRQNLMNEDQRARWLQVAIDVVGRSSRHIENPHEVDQWKETAKFVTHIHKLRGHLTMQKKDDEMLIYLEDWIVCYLDARGSYAEAAKILDRLTGKGRIVSGKQDSTILRHVSSAAIMYHKLGRLEEAEMLHLKVLPSRKKLFGAEHPDTLASMTHLASIYLDQGRLNEAEDLRVKVLAITKKVLGAEHPHTLLNMTSLAQTYSRQGRLNEAEDLQVKVLAITKMVLGAEHPHTLLNMTSLAQTYSRQGRLNDAEDLQVKVLAITKKVLGAEHPHTLLNMTSLAQTYSRQGRLNDAEDLLVKVLAITKKVLGAEHPHTLLNMTSLAQIYCRQGRLNDAEDLLVKALAMKKKVLGAEHPDTLISMGNLATTYYEQGRLNEAEDLLVKVLAMRKKVFGAEHPDTLISMGNLATTYYKQGRLNEAEDLCAEVLAVRTRVLGADHTETLTTLNNYAIILKRCRQFDGRLC